VVGSGLAPLAAEERMVPNIICRGPKLFSDCLLARNVDLKKINCFQGESLCHSGWLV
jgi:hypothetical protein